MGSGDEDRREPLRGQRRNIRRPTRSGGGWTSRPGKAGRNSRQCSRTNQQNRARNSIIGTQNRQSNSKPNTVQQIGAQSRPRATAEPRTEIHSDSPTRQQRSATTRHDAQVLIEGGVEERVEHAVGVAEHRDDVHPGQRPPRRPASTTAASVHHGGRDIISDSDTCPIPHASYYRCRGCQT